MVKAKQKEKVKLIYLGPHKVGLPSGTILDDVPKKVSSEVRMLIVPVLDAQHVSKLINDGGNAYSKAFRKIAEEERNV